MKLSSHTEIPYIHLIRVIACILVVMRHSVYRPIFYAPDTIQNKLFTIFIEYTTITCVPLFFMITGALILPIKQPDFLSFYKKRIPKVLYPLLIWGVVYAILPTLLGNQDLPMMWKELVLSPIKPPSQIGGILWYLFILIGLYLFLPFLNPDIFLNKKKLICYLFIWFIASITFDLSHWNNNLFGAYPAEERPNLFYYWGSFLGYLILGYFFHNESINAYKRTTFIMVFLFICSFFYRSTFNTNNYLSFSTIMITISVFFMLQKTKLNIHSYFYNILKHISNLSFGIYLSHMVIFKCITEKIYSTIGDGNWYLQIFVMLITFVSAYIFTWILSTLPYKKYIIG